MGPKTRTITDSKSVLSLFSTDPPSRLGQIRRFTDLPQYHWHRLFATYYLSYLFSNRNQPRGEIGDLGICQHHKAWAADFDENGNAFDHAFDIGFCFRPYHKERPECEGWTDEDDTLKKHRLLASTRLAELLLLDSKSVNVKTLLEPILSAFQPRDWSRRLSAIGDASPPRASVSKGTASERGGMWPAY